VSYSFSSKWMTPMKNRMSDHLKISPQFLRNRFYRVKFSCSPRLLPLSSSSLFRYISSVISNKLISAYSNAPCDLLDDFLSASRQRRSNLSWLTFSASTAGYVTFLGRVIEIFLCLEGRLSFLSFTCCLSSNLCYSWEMWVRRVRMQLFSSLIE
jgi:hypothetical protein